MSACWPVALLSSIYISLPFSSSFNCLTLSLSQHLRITAAVISLWKNKIIISPKRSQTIQGGRGEDKGAEMSQAGGVGWAVTWACSEVTHESVAGAPTSPSTTTTTSSTCFQSVTPQILISNGLLVAAASVMKAFTHSDGAVGSHARHRGCRQKLA